MAEDRRAHERIDVVEQAHLRLEQSLLENTAMTRQIAENTAELVALVKGVKGLRTFVVWVTPIFIGIAAIITWWQMKE